MCSLMQEARHSAANDAVLEVLASAVGCGTTPQPIYRPQYLAKNPHGYRCHANTGVKFPA